MFVNKQVVTHMKKTLLLLILCIGFLSFNKSDIKTIEGKLTEAQLSFVIKNYNWTSEKILIVNFRQPKSSCHYDNYKNLEKSSKWWAEFYSKMDLQNLRNIFVYSDNLRAKKIIDSKKHYADINNFFLKQFFSQDKTCYGILVINKNGKYQKKVGEYMQKDIEELIKELE